MLIPKNQKWIDLTNPYNASITINFTDYDVQKIISELITKNFYTKIPEDEINWRSEEKKL